MYATGLWLIDGRLSSRRDPFGGRACARCDPGGMVPKAMRFLDWLIHPRPTQLDRIETLTERILMSEAELDTAIARLTADVRAIPDLVAKLVADHPELADETADLTALSESLEAALPPEEPTPDGHMM